MKLRFFVLFIGFTLSTFAQNPNDCTNAIVICGDSNIELDATGIGFDEFSIPGNNRPECYDFNSNTIWFRLETVSDGTFSFDLIPNVSIADYDFAIYGPVVTCSTLGSTIRCSSTNPYQAGISGNTGLNMTETDINEGPGEDGNGYLRYIDALAGDVYYLLLDRAEGTGGFSISYTGTADLRNTIVANQVENQMACDSDPVQDGFTPFNLDTLIPQVIGYQTNATVTFHGSLNDANIGIDALVSPYTNIANPQTIYARIIGPSDCTDITSFTIETGRPGLQIPEDVVLCGQQPAMVYILNTINPELISNPSDYLFSYHESQSDADDNINPIGSTTIFTAIPKTIYVRATGKLDPLCFSTTHFSGYTILSYPASTPADIVVCDDDSDGIVNLNFSEKDEEIIGSLPSSSYNVYYYTSTKDRVQDINRIEGLFQNTSSYQTIYATLFDLTTGCSSYTEFNLTINPKPQPAFTQESYLYCLNATEPLKITVQNLYANYEWNTGDSGSDKRSIFVDAPGIYTVTVTNHFGCDNSVSIEVKGSDIATIAGISIVDFSTPYNSITVNAAGIGDYVYSINNTGYFKHTNSFEELGSGYFTVSVKDKNGCGIVSERVLLLDYPKYFTPNEDGYHDFWQINGLDEFPKSKLYIFDRYGKLLQQIKTDSKGWDGNNQLKNPLPSSDYWFVLELEDGRTVKGHFTLKR